MSAVFENYTWLNHMGNHIGVVFWLQTDHGGVVSQEY